jgi:hypothetical protein
VEVEVEAAAKGLRPNDEPVCPKILVGGVAGGVAGTLPPPPAPWRYFCSIFCRRTFSFPLYFSIMEGTLSSFDGSWVS